MILRQTILLLLLIFVRNPVQGSENESVHHGVQYNYAEYVNPGLQNEDSRVTIDSLRDRAPAIAQTYFLVRVENGPGRDRFSPGRQNGKAGQPARPVRVRVVNQFSEPVVGMPVIFEVVEFPAGGNDYRLGKRLITTDSAGMAQVEFRPGTAPGEYQLLSRIRSAGDENVQLFNFYVREPDWLLFLFVGLVGGLALFLLGMDIMSRGLLKAAGGKMRTILGRLTDNRIAGMGVGALVTMIIQSSSATSVMLVSFVNAKMMKFRQSLGVILGAAIGTTITAQLIAFRLTDFSLLFIAVGFALQALSGREQYKNAGTAILGFGILFFGMHIMSESMYPLRNYEPFIQILLKFEYPLLGILAGAVFTALIQSSSAFIGIMIILGMQGLISLEASIPLLFGANIGTAVTAVLASINAGREARKVALAVTLFKVFGVLLFIWWIEPFAHIIEAISPAVNGATGQAGGSAEVIPRQIANAHTLYNVFVAFLVLPFTGILEKVVGWMMPPGRIKEKQDFTVLYLDDTMLKTPALALSLAKQEVIRMGEMVFDLAGGVMPAFHTKDGAAIKEMESRGKDISFLSEKINAYLLKISRAGVRQARVNESFQMLYTVKELDHIAGVVSGPVTRLAESWIESGYSFSNEGSEELDEYNRKTCKLIKRAIEVFSGVNIDKALEMKQKYEEYRSISFEFEKMHYERLKQEMHDTVLSSKVHLELMALMRVMSSHATNIARILLKWPDETKNG